MTWRCCYRFRVQHRRAPLGRGELHLLHPLRFHHRLHPLLLVPVLPFERFFQAIYDAVRAITNPILWPIRSRIPMLRLGWRDRPLPDHRDLRAVIARSLLLIVIDQFIRPVTG